MVILGLVAAVALIGAIAVAKDAKGPIAQFFVLVAGILAAYIVIHSV